MIVCPCVAETVVWYCSVIVVQEVMMDLSTVTVAVSRTVVTGVVGGMATHIGKQEYEGCVVG